MKSLDLMSIPVYICKEVDFDEKYQRKYILPHEGPHSPLDLADSLRGVNYPKNVWRFNQIVGYIIVRLELLSDNAYGVSLDKWITVARRINIGSRKDNIAPSANTGDHFIINSWDRTWLKQEVKKYIEHDSLYSGRHIDYREFDLYMDVVDFDRLKSAISLG